ncbi:hypothetical protein QTJ10_10950 [Xanthomonas hortorum pv. vitians]|uniref:hypothetical protein n=1 Tax=Xanthomonas hortorum TaxID=56454 RepID=UPI0025A202DF|nr:hypothetical protein [Xanthomonas hortorum]WJM78527.1 hypothetical protein QTJ10_10950 [Xanthomonas hortorum pv. vitians]
MDLLSFVKASGAPVVIVDDLLAPTQVKLRADIKAQWSGELRDPATCREVAELLGLPANTPYRQVFQDTVDRVSELWNLYQADSDRYSALTTLLTTAISENAQASRSRDLIAQLKNLGLEPKEYFSLEDAAVDLARACLAFVDLFVDPSKQGDFDGIVETHEKYREQYREMFEANGERWPKLVVLISSDLPDEQRLREFRRQTGIRSAFFKGMKRRDITDATVKGLISSWSPRYQQSAEMGRYLDAVSSLVTSSAMQVAADIDRLEVHDLAVMDMARLMADGSKLHSYLGWFVSELMAARARRCFSDNADRAPERATSGAVDPRLVDSSSLFDLFAEIAVAPVNAEGSTEFGEILAPASVSRSEKFEVLVAISPACDLARCAADFEVLLMRGSLKPTPRDTATLLSLGAAYGKGSSFVTYYDDGELLRGLVEWRKGDVVTRPAGELNDPDKFVRLTRLSEIFAHEVKDFVLSNLSRVGLPVAPNVQAVATVEVSLSLQLGRDIDPISFRNTVPNEGGIAALITKGRAPGERDEDEVVMLTGFFREWLLDTVGVLLEANAANAKAGKILGALKDWEYWAVGLAKGKVPGCEDAVVKKGVMPDKPGSGLQIWVNPAT